MLLMEISIACFIAMTVIKKNKILQLFCRNAPQNKYSA